jgi:hypothetical protein
MKSAITVAASLAFALVLTTAAVVVYFVLPDTLAALMTEQFGSAPVDFVRSLMCA